MKMRIGILVSVLLAGLATFPVNAQPGPGMGGMSGMGPGMGGGMMQGGGPATRAPRDCTTAPNPEACKAHQEARAKAQAACKNETGPQRRQCLQEQRQNFDCSKSGNPQQCEARKQVYKECQVQTGPAFRQCVQQKMPPVDCSKAFDPARCDVHQKARAACKDKFGPEHRACVLQQLNVK